MEDNYFVRDTLSDRTADFIRRGILYLGNYKNGDHILEMEISEQLQVSRTTVREALKILETQGIVEITPRRGNLFLFLDLVYPELRVYFFNRTSEHFYSMICNGR